MVYFLKFNHYLPLYNFSKTIIDYLRANNFEVKLGFTH